MIPTFSSDARLLVLVVVLLLVPRALQRARVPAGIGALLLGVGAALLQIDVGSPQTVHLLSTLGISALFLFAGMDVDLAELRRGGRVLAGHVAIQALLLAPTALGIRLLFDLAWAPALIFALALVTPSTGFILDSLSGFGLTREQEAWVKSKAIATELVALGALFVIVQSETGVSLVVSSVGMALLVVTLPWAFHLFARHVLPWAPRSEFTFLVVVAILAALATRELGVYYLVGAFVVGVTSLRLRQRVPELGSPQLLGAVEFFASFFVPFYFFEAGFRLRGEDLGPRAFLFGALLLVAAVPPRTLAVTLHRRLALKEPVRESSRVAVSLLPTLVFTLVLSDILRERYALPHPLVGALVVFAIVTTAAPALCLRGAAPPASAPVAPPDAPAAAPQAGPATEGAGARDRNR